MIIDCVSEIIGNTPLLNLNKATGLPIFAKAEYLNPGGSIKDRVAQHMLEAAEKSGQLKPGMTIMEPTSGNTGIGIALLGGQKGYKVVIVMPANMSDERKRLIRALGAELVLTDPALSLDGSVAEVKRRQQEDPAIFVPQQFDNPANPQIHYQTTAPEIWQQMGQSVDIFISGLGSGGTLQGVGQFLKERNPAVRVIAAEPKNVSALLGHEPGLHKIQGIGDGFIPSILDVSLIDDVTEVSDEDAIATARQLARTQGILAGTSAGANVWAGLQAAKKYGSDKRIVTILPDRIERYFSTALI